ncbi:MAG: EF-hand domain-containing protein, partial [Bradyrhizobium sp.]
MLPAIGAASAALDAIQSLTSSQSTSSQPTGGFGPALSDAEDSSSTPQTASNAVSGFNNALISSNNFNALI